MSRIKMPEFPVWKKREYNEQDIINFSAELEKYRIWGKDPFDPDKKIKYLLVGGAYAYLQDKKIIESLEKIKPEMKTMSDLPNWRIIFARHSDYIEHENKIKQYLNWKYQNQQKAKFADMKKLEGWDSIAKSMPEILQSEKGETTTKDIDEWLEN